jgi:uncharacterized protein (UPF0218 family)
MRKVLKRSIFTGDVKDFTIKSVKIESVEISLVKRRKILIAELNTAKQSLDESIRRKNSNQITLINPPGYVAKDILTILFSKKTFSNVFAQVIIDMREEYAEALADKKYRKARWIVIRDHIGLGVTVAAYIGSTVVKRAVGIWKMIP